MSLLGLDLSGCTNLNYDLIFTGLSHNFDPLCLVLCSDKAKSQ